jgi:hypothetical protein
MAETKTDFESVSEVDHDELNGGHRKTDWRDARLDPTADPGGPRFGGQPQRGGGRPNQNETGTSMKPQLEDGAD